MTGSGMAGGEGRRKRSGTDGMVADDGKVFGLQLSRESLEKMVGSSFGHAI